MNAMYENAIPLPASNALLSLNQSARSSPHYSGNAQIPAPGMQVPGIFASPVAGIQQQLQQQQQPTSVINMSNSTDVVIGPMTQYQGPVTIYMDATVEARSNHGNHGIQHSHLNQQTSLSQKLKSNLSLTLFILIAFIIGTVAIVYLLLDKINKENSVGTKQILFGNNYETGTFPNLGNGHLVIDREQWGAQDTSEAKYFKLINPIPYVLITHVGVQSSNCANIYRCSIKMRSWQDSAIAERKLPDITSNFFIGDDGNIYVGRGWEIANTYSNNTLAITFMGDFVRNEPGKRQLEAAQYLITYGVTNRNIALDYKLVAHNQTKKTFSPGVNVYKHIIKWPHWYPCGIDDNPRCGIEIGLPPYWNKTNEA